MKDITLYIVIIIASILLTSCTNTHETDTKKIGSTAAVENNYTYGEIEYYYDATHDVGIWHSMRINGAEALFVLPANQIKNADKPMVLK